MKELLIWSLDKARQQTFNLVADLDETQMCHQSIPGENHPAWTLGHLFLADCLILSLLQVASAPKMPQTWWEIYAPGHAPTSDNQKFHPKEQLVQQLLETDSIRKQAIERLTLADLAQPNPEPRIAATQPTIGHVLHYLLFHEGNHAGQLAAWRKRRGLPSGSGVFGIV